MGASSAVLSRDMYDEAKRYVLTVLQAGVPLVDADYNDQMLSFFTQLRRLISNSIGDGARGVAFKIEQNPVDLVNNFKILGGVITDEGPEELFVKGHQAQLDANETYLGGGETAPVSTAIIVNQLIDTAGNFVPGSLVGKTLIPNLGNPTQQFPITANTATSITCAVPINAVSAAGDQYRIKLTTPVANRKDLVFLDVYLDEIQATEDNDLEHVIDAISIEAMRRKKLVQRIFVTEGITLPVVLPSGFVDADANRHVLIPLALIERPAGDPNITDPMITDLRRKIFRLDEFEDRFVNTAGDTMTGPLVFDPGVMIQGICVVDGDALCNEVVQARHFKRDDHLLGDGDQVPTFEQVNDVDDPGHFKVHDNRYYTRSEVDNLIGSNLLSNGGFENGFGCWENAAPQVLLGAPQADAAQNVRVSIGLCGSACLGILCACRTLKVCVAPGSKVCFVCPVRQEIDCLKCGGEFLLIQTLCVTKGDDCIIPFVVLDLFVSCQYVGTKKVRLFEPTPEHPCITQEDGFMRLEKKISLPGCIDKVVYTLCYEIVPKAVLPDEEEYGYQFYQPEGQSTLNAKCEVGEAGLEWAVCAAQFRRLSGLEQAGEPASGCGLNSEVMIDRAHLDGTVEFTPGHGQVATVVEMLEEGSEGGGPVVGSCLVPGLFSDCFTGLLGSVPQGGWSFSPGVHPGPLTTFDGDQMVHTHSEKADIRAKKALGGPPLLTNFTLQFKFTMGVGPLHPGRSYDVILAGADSLMKFGVFMGEDPAEPGGGVFSVLIGVGAFIPVFRGNWTPLPGSTYQVHVSVDGAGVPTAFINGVAVPLVSAPVGSSGGVNAGPNVVVVRTTTYNDDAPLAEVKRDWVFVHDAPTPPTTVFCCPDGSPAQ